MVMLVLMNEGRRVRVQTRLKHGTETEIETHGVILVRLRLRHTCLGVGPTLASSVASDAGRHRTPEPIE